MAIHNKAKNINNNSTRGAWLASLALIAAPFVITHHAVADGATNDQKGSVSQGSVNQNAVSQSFYGTLEPMAKRPIYFVVTDRFADGDPTNNQLKQGGQYPTFNQPLTQKGANKANIGYMGGDFKGIVNNADYIANMGFGALWLTPIVQNPDQHFTGGVNVGEAMFTDKGKTGYHGYWGINFFEVDEHWPSKDLSFKQLTQTLKKHDISTVLDIVANHGSPSFTMPVKQPLFGQLYDKNGRLKADHQNLKPTDLDPKNPLHKWYHNKEDLAELSNINEQNPEVLEYFVAAYLQWIEQGADAFRVDTIRHMPNSFWKAFSDRIREKHPGFFMFGEHFSFEAKDIAQHTFAENGSISVLDFPGRKAMVDVFENNQSMTNLQSYLHLDDTIYNNPYELATFYDNHDMARINATDTGFINLHNWLFTSRGIPVVYYGSEVGFMRGTKEHYGNRNFWGQKAIDQAKVHPIQKALTVIANIRKNSIALQQGLQVDINYGQHHGVFLRVYQHEGVSSSALVLLNRSKESQVLSADQFVQAGQWQNVVTGKKITHTGGRLSMDVPANGFIVLQNTAPVTEPALIKHLCKLPRVECPRP